MNSNKINAVIKEANNMISEVANIVSERVKRIPLKSVGEIIKKPWMWVTVSASLIGVAGGVLLRQPEINKLSEEVRKSHSEIERLHIIVQSYHEEFVRLQAKVNILKTKGFAEDARKESENGRASIMYQYAAKEYIELCLRPRDDRGVLVLSEEENHFYFIFKKVINGEMLEREDAKKLQNYVYPKYEQEIEGLIEFNFNGLLKKLSA